MKTSQNDQMTMLNYHASPFLAHTLNIVLDEFRGRTNLGQPKKHCHFKVFHSGSPIDTEKVEKSTFLTPKMRFFFIESNFLDEFERCGPSTGQSYEELCSGSEFEPSNSKNEP